jgi:hypothetical protein
MSDNIMKKVINRAQKATDKAVERSMNLAGTTSDPDVLFYNSIKPEEFDAIASRFGVNETMEYIQDMESRRIK